MLTTVKNSKNLWSSQSDGTLTPFFWLGDTAWLMLQKLSLQEIEEYFKNRAARSFNVIQAVLMHNKNVASSADDIYVDLNSPQDSGAYWQKAETVLRIAEKHGLYIAFLPVWGSMVKKGYLTAVNAEQYAAFLAERFGKFKNLIWVLGGDIRGHMGFDIWDIMGRTLKKLCPARLITFHPFGRTSSAMWFHDKEWLDFNMFQSGHRRYDQYSLGEWDDNKESEDFYAEDNWKYVRRELMREPMKPVLDGEPSYENIPQGLHDFTQPFWQAKDVRRYAYWSVFEGACGHTYGCNSVFQFYSPGDTDGGYNVQEYWTEGIQLPGAMHMKHLYSLITSVDFAGGSHDDALVSNDGFEKHDRITAFTGESFALIYNYSGREFTINRDLSGTAQWFDPTSGEFSPAQLNGVIRPPRNSAGETDMVLVIK
ncbi:MAG TPA: glycoside hydrolase family 140 protein [Candidatus Monoglobus merdigallinarum]|uniref:Glycoside hydrolase family 140 protein n=1 Tax=Candidatus Monoglobus merdigallinarum TaxID=2838698 RepID=A0A9D1TL02_9FIRM|nr:glycoside hydrolase family 140 protein [Candidatus Monoglobus merdigallinarum]